MLPVLEKNAIFLTTSTERAPFSFDRANRDGDNRDLEEEAAVFQGIEQCADWIGGTFRPEHFDPEKATKRMQRGLPDWRKMA